MPCDPILKILLKRYLWVPCTVNSTRDPLIQTQMQLNTTATSKWRLRPCLVCFFSSINFHHLSLITHHFKYYTRLAPLLNIFHTICGPYTCHSLQASSFFSSVPKLTLPSGGKKKKKDMKTEPVKKD